MATKKPMWQTQWNRHKVVLSKNSSESLTIPDLSYTIPELLQRHASGRLLGVKVYDEYGGDAEHLTGVDIRTLDIAEIGNVLTKLRSNLEAAQNKHNELHAMKQQEEMEKSIEAKLKAKHALKSGDAIQSNSSSKRGGDDPGHEDPKP